MQPILRQDFYFLNFGRKRKTFREMNVLVLFLYFKQNKPAPTI